MGMSFAVPRIGTAMAAIFVGAIPLFTMLIGRLWGLEQITARGQLGLVFGFGGIVLLVGFPAVPITGSFLLGCAAALAGSVSAAFGSNYARRRLQGTGSYEVSTGSFLFGGLMMLPLLALVPVPGPPTVADFGYLLVLAAMMSSLAYVLFFRLVAELGATRAISVEFFVTAIAVTIGSVVEHERLSVPQIAGAVVIIAGCVLVLGLVPARRKNPLGSGGPATLSLSRWPSPSPTTCSPGSRPPSTPTRSWPWSPRSTRTRPATGTNTGPASSPAGSRFNSASPASRWSRPEAATT